MIILLYGPNTYARDEKARELIESARIKYPTASYEVISGDEDGVYQVHSFLSETGLFAGGKKILHIRRASLFSDLELWMKDREKATRDDVLCIISEDWHTRECSEKELELLIGVDYKMQFFAPYNSLEASRLLAVAAHTQGSTLESSAAALIYAYAHMDMGGALQEIARLSLLTQSITAAVVRTLPEYAESVALFDFARAITSSATRARRLMLWEYMKFQHVDMYMIFGYLAKMAKKEGLIHALAQADILVKSGRLEIDHALEQIVIA